jgi:polyribonucleotide nucleotidyltransferase
MEQQVKTMCGGNEIFISTGKMAKQADGSVIVQCGGTMVLVAACCAKKANPGLDFFPLTVEYQEKTFAAGKIPGGFFKREGKPTEKAVLTSRMIDRPIRPLFPEGMSNEVQVIATVISIDSEHDADILAIIGASSALTISNIPFDGPIAAVRVGMLDGKLILNPTMIEIAKSSIDLVVVGSETDVTMLECGAHEVTEEKMLEAIKFGHEGLKPIIAAQKELQKRAGKPKRKDIVYSEISKEVTDFLKANAADRLSKMLVKPEKQARVDEMDLIIADMVSKLVKEDGDVTEGEVKKGIFKLEEEIVRNMILKQKKRTDGRGLDELRKLSSEVNLLPVPHGSALFTRGETQSLSAVTLGTDSDEQIIDGLEGEYKKGFMLHYNFPPFSVGEVKPMRGTGRREIGHGNLAFKALQPMMPTKEEFPYTIRVVSEILESNGSSSMATVCAGSLSLMAGGVPVKAAVSGIAMGLISDGKDYAVLTDIAGVEDHCGDMDFKVAGTRAGITAVQMDIKIKGISFDILKDGLEKAKKGRLQILEHMSRTIAQPASDISPYAPRIVTVKVKQDKIREVIGPGGKVIKKIIAETGADINIDDDGNCQIASANKEALDKAVQMVRDIIAEPEVGKVYNGKITKLMNFGAFCEFMPGREGLIHVSEMSATYVKDVKEVLKEGDEVKVILFEIDDQHRNNLSIKRIPAPEQPEGKA